MLLAAIWLCCNIFSEVVEVEPIVFACYFILDNFSVKNFALVMETQ